MEFIDVQHVLAEHGLVGTDAETAFACWQHNPTGADGCRVQRVLEVEGLA